MLFSCNEKFGFKLCSSGVVIRGWAVGEGGGGLDNVVVVMGNG